MLIQDNINQGVKYFVLDYWARRIFEGGEYDALEQAISRHARLAQRIGTGINYVEIYELVPEGKTILNGDFSKWAQGEFTMVPDGWQPILLAGEGGSGDSAAISQDYIDGRQCVRLEVKENGLLDGKRETTFCRIYQSIPFPENVLTAEIMPTFNTTTEENGPESGIIFIGDGHTLTVTFSDAIDKEQFTMSANGHSATVIRPAGLGQWSTETIDLASYWAQAGWELPDEINISFFVSIHNTHPGKYDFYIASIAEER
jgi:hypothetical protein